MQTLQPSQTYLLSIFSRSHDFWLLSVATDPADHHRHHPKDHDPGQESVVPFILDWNIANTVLDRARHR